MESAGTRAPRRFRELGFRHRRHSNDVHSPAPIEIRFGAGREERPLDAHVRSALAHARAYNKGCAVQSVLQTGVHRISEAHVRDTAWLIKERRRSLARTIDELIDEHHVARSNRFLHGTDSRHANDLFRAQHL